jgi:23S rRNA pseudouridine2605 synthase
VNGRVVTDPLAAVHPERDVLAIQGVERARAPWRTLALYKPRGVVTSRRDPQGRTTVFDLLGTAGKDLVAVGRLDLATTGLLILTSDTQLAERLTNPDRAVIRRYVVTVRGLVSDREADAIRHGIDDMRAASIDVRKRSARESHLIVELTEGRNREVRRLFGAVGHEVTRLLRVAYGPIELGSLQPGAWRELTPEAFAGW